MLSDGVVVQPLLNCHSVTVTHSYAFYDCLAYHAQSLSGLVDVLGSLALFCFVALCFLVLRLLGFLVLRLLGILDLKWVIRVIEFLGCLELLGS